MLTSSHRSQLRRRQWQGGMSLIELLIGAALGLVLATWAISMFVTSLGNNRTLTTEARVNQGLRAAADLIVRDLRRAGYWGDAIAGTITGTGAMSAATTANPYKAVSADSGASTINYNFSRDVEDNTLSANEQFGFRLNSGVIQMQTASGTWVAVTDSAVLTVTGMTIAASDVPIYVGNACPNDCPATDPTCPRVRVRSYGIVLDGRSVADSAITRTLRTNVRVRNDELTGVCPTS
jgi:prepilin peptidase dependent protein B